MRNWIFITALSVVLPAQSDSIRSYMNIAGNIPKMEIKADSQAQAWARSARNVLHITSESIAETILQANKLATKDGHPLFCLPAGVTLNGKSMDRIIRQSYQELQSQNTIGNQMTVSEIAWQGVIKKYPCRNRPRSNRMEHVAAILER